MNKKVNIEIFYHGSFTKTVELPCDDDGEPDVCDVYEEKEDILDNCTLEDLGQIECTDWEYEVVEGDN